MSSKKLKKAYNRKYEKIDRNRTYFRVLPVEIAQIILPYLDSLDILSFLEMYPKDRVLKWGIIYKNHFGNYRNITMDEYLYLSNIEKLKYSLEELSALSLDEIINLEKLILTDPRDTLPSEIGYLINLKEIAANNIGLRELPVELFNLFNLELLDLHHNKLTTIPDQIKKLKNLKGLRLSYNELTELPYEIGYLSNLEGMYVDHNKLEGIPEEISQLKKLRYLEADSNRIKREPSKLHLIPHLKYKTFDNNPLDFRQTLWF